MVTKGGKIESISKEVKTYTIDDHFKENWLEAKELFNILHEKILALDPNLTCSPQKQYIGYKIENKVVISITIRKSGPSIELPRFRPEDLNDPEKKVIYVKDSFKYWGKHLSKMQVIGEEDIDYALMLAKQVYKKFISNYEEKE